jgi:hypothetical protein
LAESGDGEQAMIRIEVNQQILVSLRPPATGK